MRFKFKTALFCKILCLFTLSLLISCSKLEAKRKQMRTWFSDNGRLKIACTTSPIRDLTEALTVGLADTCALIDSGLDPHAYELVKGDGEKLEGADLVIALGLGLEHGASISSALKKSPKCLFIGHYLKEHLPERLIYVEGELDPHVWMDLELFSESLEPICQSLCRLLPQHEALLVKRKEALKKRLMILHSAFRSKLQSLPRSRRYLVTAHDAFNYFTRAYLAETSEQKSGSWKKRLIACEGLAPEGQVATSDLRQVIHFIEKNRSPCAFAESNLGRGFLHKILEVTRKRAKAKTSFEIAQSPLCADTMLGGEGFDYVHSMAYNVELIYQELSKDLP